MVGEHEFEGKNFSAGEVGERLAVAGVTGFVAGATGVGVVGMANRAVKLARLVRAATKAQKVARALIRIGGQSGAGAAASGITDAGRQLNTTGTINTGRLGDSMKAGAIVGGAFGTVQQAVGECTEFRCHDSGGPNVKYKQHSGQIYAWRIDHRGCRSRCCRSRQGRMLLGIELPKIEHAD